MNALSPEGFTPADASQGAAVPVARPAAGRRGSRSAPPVGGEQVRLMVDLEDEGETPGGGVVLDESAGDGMGAGSFAADAGGGAEPGLHEGYGAGSGMVSDGPLGEDFAGAAFKGQGDDRRDGMAGSGAAALDGADGNPDRPARGGPAYPSGDALAGDGGFAASGTPQDPAGAGRPTVPSQAQRQPFGPAGESLTPAAPAVAQADASAAGLSGRHGASLSGAAESSAAQGAAAPVWDRAPPALRTGLRSRAQAEDRAMTQFGVPAQLTGIEVTLSVQIGSHPLPLRDLLSVEPGLLVPLDRMTSEPVDILVNGRLFARGEVVAIGDRFGVRLLSLVDATDAG